MSQTRAEIEQELREVRAAISARLNGIGHLEGHSANGQAFQYTPIKDLYDIRDRLVAELRSKSGPRVLRPSFPRRGR